MSQSPKWESGLIGASFCGAHAQNSSASDAEAIELAAQSLAAIAGKTNISDVTLAGTATLNKQEIGTKTFGEKESTVSSPKCMFGSYRRGVGFQLDNSISDDVQGRS